MHPFAGLSWDGGGEVHYLTCQLMTTLMFLTSSESTILVLEIFCRTMRILLAVEKMVGSKANSISSVSS